MLPLRHGDSYQRQGCIRRNYERVKGWLRLIWQDQNSRNLLGFLTINLTFAFVELFYGIITNSLGLISDACHMFFDCTGLLFGLVATVVTRWRATTEYSYGYVRAEILSGFINGLFLLFVAFFIFSEAVERLAEPPEVKHERLLIVSVLGLIVNLIGIFIFQHGGAGHGHSHGGDGHGHGHSHGGGHGHGHSHGGSDAQIMKGVFLHILADTLGSVGVIISALLMQWFGWMIADPICSMCIAILIFISIGSIIMDSGSILMQRQPKELDHKLPECYDKIKQLRGVQGVQEPHFWTLCTNSFCGGLKLEVSRDADAKYVISHTQMIFREVGVNQLYVQLDYEFHSDAYQNLREFPSFNHQDQHHHHQHQNHTNHNHNHIHHQHDHHDHHGHHDHHH